MLICYVNMLSGCCSSSGFCGGSSCGSGRESGRGEVGGREMGEACKEKAGREAQRRELERGGGGAQVRVARNDSGAGAGRGKVSAENWGVKGFKRREQKKNKKKAYLTKSIPDLPPLAAVMFLQYVMLHYII